MKVTDLTRSRLLERRTRRTLLAHGFEEVGEGGGRLWELYRGARIGFKITDVRIAPEGRSVFVKITDANPMPAQQPLERRGE
jgi:hypothetical protein